MSHPLRHVFLQGYLILMGHQVVKRDLELIVLVRACLGRCGVVTDLWLCFFGQFIEVEPKKVIEDRVVNQRNYIR